MLKKYGYFDKAIDSWQDALALDIFNEEAKKNIDDLLVTIKEKSESETSS